MPIHDEDAELEDYHYGEMNYEKHEDDDDIVPPYITEPVVYDEPALNNKAGMTDGPMDDWNGQGMNFRKVSRRGVNLGRCVDGTVIYW